MEYIRPFTRLSKGDVNLAGGKGASLGEMTQAGIPVPSGFVILSTAFEAFLEETNLHVEMNAALNSINLKEMHTIEHASEKIQALMMDVEMPQVIGDDIKKHFGELGATYVAVRSSATAEDSASAAWAGQLDSFLNTTEEHLLENVQRCWASLFTPRAIFYRFEKELHHQKISVAVVVQKMVESETSGIAFSVHPVTQDRNQLIIEAGFGLGEAIVSGQITPDSYVVEKEPRQIIDAHVEAQERGLYRAADGGNEWRDIPKEKGERQVLSADQILKLSDIILRIEKHYGFPCDIEWAAEEGEFFVVQSRPITTLGADVLKEGSDEAKQTFIKAYTRNFSIIMQQAWFAGNKEGFITKLGLQDYPYDSPYLYFMKDGVEEVWENTRANRWILDRIIEKLTTDKSFLLELHKRYFDRLTEVEKWWKKDINTISDLQKFIDIVFDGVSDFVFLYNALMDEAVPEEYQNMASAFRGKDVFFAECNATIRRALDKIFPELGYLVVYITREELGKKIDIEELRKRDKGFVLIPGVYQGTISFEELEKKFLEYSFEHDKVEYHENFLKGQSAYRGKVSGKVRIVKRTDQAEKVIEGEIIVSPMTTPDFAPAMKNAAAFVTDEGGVTCHAAIIAREIRKPCVVGTKIATQVLKDGDMVEVDADNGIVRILK